MAPAVSLLTASALLLALAALRCHPVAAGIVKATKPKLLPSPDKFVELNFFLHNLVRLPSGSATAFFVVDPLDGLPPNGLEGSSLFGGVVVLDDKLTAGPSQSSLEIGRAKGFYVFDSLDAANPSAETVFTAVFNEASGFPGSTIQFRGYVLLAPGPLHEFAVAGGTGEFRLARGWADFTAKSLSPYSASYNITASVYYGGSGRYTYAY